METVYIKPQAPNKIVDEDGTVYKSVNSLERKIKVGHTTILNHIRKSGAYRKDGHTYRLLSQLEGFESTKDLTPRVKTPVPEVVEPGTQGTTVKEEDPEYLEFLKKKEAEALPFETYKIEDNKDNKAERYAIALFSDAHIEETVTSDSTMGLNEYNIEIAEERIKKYFSNLASCINEDRVEMLYFASLGDTISGYIHDELRETNSMSPLEATLKGQSLIYSGLEYLLNNCKKLKKILFIGICGNHSRLTKKVQHSNGYALSAEFMMYKNIEQRCKDTGLPIDFMIPESEMVIVDTPDNKRFIFIHGFQLHYRNGVGGIFPALNRLTMRYDNTFKQTKTYLGHFHSCTDIGSSMVNGSIISYTSFSLTNGFPYERPAQMYEVRKVHGDVLLTRKIYCD